MDRARLAARPCNPGIPGRLEPAAPPIRNAKLRPEAELLLCCARLAPGPAARERILQLLRGPIDWADLIELATRHGLRPLLYRHLDALAPAAVPPPVLAGLWAWYERTANLNRSMAHELLRILRLLDSNAIAALPYKGPALAASVYGNLALREFGDLDILLRPQDIAPAKALLVAQGFRPEYGLQPAVEAEMLRSSGHYHLALVHRTSSLVVELHWATDIDFPVEAVLEHPWWLRSETAALENEQVPCFALPELLLILCLHGSKHHWSSMGWLVDVAELIRANPELNWEWVFAKAHQLKCRRRLALGLLLADRLLDAPLPPQVRHAVVAVRGVEDLSVKVARMLLAPRFEGTNTLQALNLDLKLYDHPRQRLAHLLRVTFAPGLVEWSNWPMPRALFFLHYPLRLIRLAGKYGQMLLRKRTV